MKNGFQFKNSTTVGIVTLDTQYVECVFMRTVKSETEETNLIVIGMTSGKEFFVDNATPEKMAKIANRIFNSQDK